MSNDIETLLKINNKIENRMIEVAKCFKNLTIASKNIMK